MSHKRSGKTADSAHRRSGGRREPARPPGDHAEERRIDESLEESFPASDPPAHVKDPAPAEGERRPEDDEEDARAEDPRATGDVRSDDVRTRAPDDAEGGIGGRPVDLDDAIDSGEE